MLKCTSKSPEQRGMSLLQIDDAAFWNYYQYNHQVGSVKIRNEIQWNIFSIELSTTFQYFAVSFRHRGEVKTEPRRHKSTSLPDNIELKIVLNCLFLLF